MLGTVAKFERDMTINRILAEPEKTWTWSSKGEQE
jgi:hypothetical protein